MSARDTDVLGIDKAAEVRALGKRLEAQKEADTKAWKAEQDRHQYEQRETLYVRATRHETPNRLYFEGEIIAGLPAHIQARRIFKVRAPSLDALKAEVRFAFQRLLIGWLIVRDPAKAADRAAKAEVSIAEVG